MDHSIQSVNKKQITFDDLKNRNFDTKGITKHFCIINCEKCNITTKFLVISFCKRKYRENLCTICYRLLKMYDIDWRNNNSKSQFIAQNKPEVIEKQRLSQLKRFSNGRS